MRRPRTAFTSASAGAIVGALVSVGLITPFASAQQLFQAPASPPKASSPRASTDSPSANFDPMATARNPRAMLRNGIDFVKYKDYTRALRFLREAERRQNELDPAERKALAMSIAHTTKMIEEGSVKPSAAQLANNARRDPSTVQAGAMSLAADEPAPRGDSIQLTAAQDPKFKLDTPEPAPSAERSASNEVELPSPAPGRPATPSQVPSTTTIPLEPSQELPALAPTPSSNGQVELPPPASPPVASDEGASRNAAPITPEPRQQGQAELPALEPLRAPAPAPARATEPSPAEPEARPVISLEPLPDSPPPIGRPETPKAAPVQAPAPAPAPNSVPAAPAPLPEPGEAAATPTPLPLPEPAQPPALAPAPALPAMTGRELPPAPAPLPAEQPAPAELPGLPTAPEAAAPPAAPAALPGLPQDLTPAPAPVPEPTEKPIAIAPVEVPAPVRTPGNATPPIAPVAEPAPAPEAEALPTPSIATAPAAPVNDVSATPARDEAAPVADQPTAPPSNAGVPIPPDVMEDVARVARRQALEARSMQNPARPSTADDTFGSMSIDTPSRFDLPRPPSATEARPLRRIPVPEEFTPLVKREWEPLKKYWAAAATCHMPLYFQDANLERYGNSVESFFGPKGRYLTYPLDNPKQSKQRNQILQPFFSAGLFAFQIAALPYNMVVDPPWEAEYDLGYYRPGDRMPPGTYYLPLTGVGPPLHGRQY